MEKQKLPNVTVSLVLGIISFIACCCSSGFGGVVLSGIAFFLAKKDEKTYAENPDNYDNYSQLKTAKTVALVGLILAALTLIWSIVQIQMMGGMDAYMEKIREIMEQYQ